MNLISKCWTSIYECYLNFEMLNFEMLNLTLNFDIWMLFELDIEMLNFDIRELAVLGTGAVPPPSAHTPGLHNKIPA